MLRLAVANATHSARIGLIGIKRARIEMLKISVIAGKYRSSRIAIQIPAPVFLQERLNDIGWKDAV